MKNRLQIFALVAMLFLFFWPVGYLSAQFIPWTSVTGKATQNITVLLDGDGGRMDWSPAGNDLIAFDKRGTDTYYDVYTMKSDGTQQTCITCGTAGIPQMNNGNPAWHPSGQYIAFQSVNPSLPKVSLDGPGQGINNNIWVMNSNGTNPKQITSVAFGKGVLHPHFSHNGNMLVWAERLGYSAGSSYGEWAIKLGDFNPSGNPPVTNIRTFQPGQFHYFYETHGFSVDDQKIIFSANSDGQSDTGFDIYTMDIQTQAIIKLTDTSTEWDEHSLYSPDGSKVVWISSQGITPNSNPSYRKTDFWLMNPDGSGKTRLTYFNDATAPEYISATGGIIASDSSWNPDGTKLAAYVQVITSTGSQPTVVILTLSTPPDTVPPSIPAGLAATQISSSQINLSWSPSTDNVGVIGYRVYKNSSQITTTGNVSYIDTGLAPNTTYTYTVSAFDVAGNTSVQSSSISATTPTSTPTPTPTPPPSSLPTPTPTPTFTPAPSPLAYCTMEAKLCPDGKTSVGRILPNCEFAACPTPTPIPTPIFPPTSISPVKLIRFSNDPKVYEVTEENQIKWVPSITVFNQLGLDWKNVIVEPPSKVTLYQRVKLMRAEGDTKVYYITEGGLKRHMPNPTVFLSYGNKWSDVATVKSFELSAISDNVFIREEGKPEVYKLENSAKRWIKTAEIFNKLGFKWNEIAPINAAELESYSLGTPIE